MNGLQAELLLSRFDLLVDFDFLLHQSRCIEEYKFLLEKYQLYLSLLLYTDYYYLCKSLLDQ